MNYIIEEWKEYRDDNWIEKDRYLISNYGRVKSLKVDTEKGELIKGSLVSEFLTIQGRKKEGGRSTKYIHKLVAELFMPNPENKPFVIHLDYNKTNNHLNNLDYATQEELTKHHSKNPNYLKKAFDPSWSKLTYNEAKLLKKKLLDPNRKTRMKILAKQFGVSEMQLWRIKSGENWGHIKVD